MGHGIFWNFVFPFCSICFHQGHKGIHSVLPLFLKFSISFQCVYDSTKIYPISFAQKVYFYLSYFYKIIGVCPQIFYLIIRDWLDPLGPLRALSQSVR
jgi:hypothetical protein